MCTVGLKIRGFVTYCISLKTDYTWKNCSFYLNVYLFVSLIKVCQIRRIGVRALTQSRLLRIIVLSLR